ncbi:hypothetical protein L484_004636 [Morus notabilis]|uniref:Uncharacterized protein n=1 Tax=Morus notabilis TaxID=981085 RepID=W9RSV7_9ROSA|nr:hypothetical protein L484_004636 [Morus notabilis]
MNSAGDRHSDSLLGADEDELLRAPEGVKSGDLRRNAKSEGSSLGPYRRWSAKAWGANGIRSPEGANGIRYPGAAWLSSARVVRCLVKSYNERNPRFVLLRHAPKEMVGFRIDRMLSGRVVRHSTGKKQSTTDQAQPAYGMPTSRLDECLLDINHFDKESSKNHKRSKVHRRLGSSTPGSPGSTTAGPNHTQKKSLILAQKER